MQHNRNMRRGSVLLLEHCTLPFTTMANINISLPFQTVITPHLMKRHSEHIILERLPQEPYSSRAQMNTAISSHTVSSNERTKENNIRQQNEEKMHAYIHSSLFQDQTCSVIEIIIQFAIFLWPMHQHQNIISQYFFMSSQCSMSKDHHLTSKLLMKITTTTNLAQCAKF